jgi:hypothetical protein
MNERPPPAARRSETNSAGGKNQVLRLPLMPAMREIMHRFKIGQTVDLIPSTFRSAATGNYEIVSLRPAENGNPQYRIKSKSESHERVVGESDLVPVEAVGHD